MQTKDLKVFFIYLCSLFVLLIPVFYFRYINPSVPLRLFFLRIFLISEFTFISFVLYYNINNRLLKRIISSVPLLFFLFSLYDYFVSDKSNFSYIPLAAECLILLIYIIYFFYEKININTPVPIYQTSIFWIAVAFTLYCAGNFFLFLYSNSAVKNDTYRNNYTIIYSTFTIIKNILLCIGISLKQQKKDNEYSNFLILNNPFDFNIKSKEVN